MPIDRPTLEAAIHASGGAQQPDDQVDGLLAKLQVLEAMGRYGALLKTLVNVNEKSNFFSFLLEATFAYQFEAAGMPLTYEVKQVSNQSTSIDFRLSAKTGESVFFELRLIQQDKGTADDIAKQLAVGSGYAVEKDGEGETVDIFRLQSTILSKVQRPNGTPIKFLQTGQGVVNIVVVCISDILLGAPDAFDCILTMYGDPAVPAHCRRGVFGLFQDVTTGSPEIHHVHAKKYTHIKKTIHGVLFLFRANESGVLDYHLQQNLVWNRRLVSPEQDEPLTKQIEAAMPPNR